MNEIFKCRDNNLRNDYRHILQPKRHHRVLEAALLSDERGFMSILLGDSDLVITQKPICKGVHFLTTYSFKYLISEQC